MASAYDNGPAGELPRDKPVSGLISDGLQQLSRLVRNEMALARAEVTNKARQLARGGAMVVAAAAFALPSLTMLMLALAALFIELGLSPSLSCLFTALIGFAITAVLARVGLHRLKAEALVPNRTINQLHRDATTMKQHF